MLTEIRNERADVLARERAQHWLLTDGVRDPYYPQPDQCWQTVPVERTQRQQAGEALGAWGVEAA